MRPNFPFSLELVLEARDDLTRRHGRNFSLDVSGKIWALDQERGFLVQAPPSGYFAVPCFSNLTEAMDDAAAATQSNTTGIVGIIICSSIQNLAPDCMTRA